MKGRKLHLSDFAFDEKFNVVAGEYGIIRTDETDRDRYA